MPPLEKIPPQSKPFKQRKSFATRKQEVAGIKSKFPNKIPVIIERYDKEKFLPPLDKTKFLVPHDKARDLVEVSPPSLDLRARDLAFHFDPSRSLRSLKQ
uniref:Microtubule-associated protein 1 light chain 3 gamma n=1 Tax=Oryzias sinensis TaxID=183150 RepID=A0A8C7WWA5_9TELE